MPYISIAAVSPRQVPHHTGDTCSSPPLRTEGTRSAWSRIDGIPRNSAIDRSSNSDKGHPAAACKQSQSKEGKASKSQRRVPFQTIFVSLRVEAFIIPTSLDLPTWQDAHALSPPPDTPAAALCSLIIRVDRNQHYRRDRNSTALPGTLQTE
jgi:hypothetical protein